MAVGVGVNGACLIKGKKIVQTFLNVILAISKNTKFSISNNREEGYLKNFSHFDNKNNEVFHLYQKWNECINMGGKL